MPFFVVVLYCVAIGLIYTFRLIPEDQVEACNDLTIAIVTGVGSWQVYRIMKQFSPSESTRYNWMLFAMGLLFDCIGHTFYSIAQFIVGTVLTFPHTADFFIMAGQFCYCLSFILFLVQMRKLAILSETGITWIANLIFLVLLGLNLYWIIIPTVQLEEEPIHMIALYLVYPVYDTILAYTCLHLALLFYSMGRSPLTKPWFVLVVAFLIFMVTDSVYAYVDLHLEYHPYMLINPGWGLAYILVSYATYLQQRLVKSIDITDTSVLFSEDNDGDDEDIFSTP